jgi:uncharacterized protein YjbJ (UPF0337 family)
MMANQATMTGNWNELKGRIRSKWGQLTDDMLEQNKGNMEALVGTIQRTTGEARDRIQEFLNSGSEQAGDLYNRASEAVRQGTNYASEAVRSGSNYASEAVRAGTEQAMEGAKYVGEQLRAGADQTGKLIQARPMESLMFTFGAGIVAGLALGLILRSR